MKKLLTLLLITIMLFGVNSALAEDWNCPACGYNASGSFCSNCGAAKPIVDDGSWVCSACGAEATGNFCSNCGAARINIENEATATLAPTTEPFFAPSTLKTVASYDAAELLNSAINHTAEMINPSPDKYTWYIQDYVGLNLSSVGYTSMGGDRLDRYGAGLLELYLIALDGTYIDIDDDDVLSQYMVVGQSVAPNTEMKLVFRKDSKGEEYSNLIDYQNINSLELLVVRIDGTITGKVIEYTPITINTAPDRYTCYVKNYVGKNLATIGYTSMGGDLLDEYLAARIELCPVTADGTYVDIEDEELLQQYVVVGQDVVSNTEIKLAYQKDSKGVEYDNLIDFASVTLIDLQVVRIDGAMYNDAVAYEPIEIKVSPDKYTWYIRNYVGKNLASIGYTSMDGDRYDEYGNAHLELVLVTPDRSVVDIDDEEQLATYVVTAQDIAPNSEMRLAYQKDSKGVEYANLVDSSSYKKIKLTLQKANLIPVEVPELSSSDDVPKSTAVPITANYEGTTHTSSDFTYIVQSDDAAVIVAYIGKGSSVSIPSDLDGHEVRGIGISAFENHSEISSITMWADPVFIDARAFMGCSKLKEISISSSVETIGDSAFEGCTKLSSALLWGDPDIGARAFYQCANLREISIGSSTEFIGESAFEGCTSLKSVLIWGSTNIGKSAFRDCSSLKEISINSDTESIGDYAFYGCSSLKEAIIWGSDTNLGNEAFGNCPKLVEVTQW